MIIAEVGLNHFGQRHKIDNYLDVLSQSNIDGITFQIREQEYYKKKPNLKLSDNEYTRICEFIKSKNKKFGIAIADINKIDFLESINVDFYKVIRNDITNKSLMKKLVATNKPLIISTGLSSDVDIQNFIKEFGTDNITLNHTQLSHDPKDCNLLAIQKMKDKYGCNVSFGTHCNNINVIYMSLCYYPSSILFYVKDDWPFNHYTETNFPDDEHAISLNNIHNVLNNINKLQDAIGTGTKQKMKNKIK